MRLVLAATTLLLCFGLMSCNDDGDSKPIGPPTSQACNCKPGEQRAPQLKPQVTDGGSGTAHGWHVTHRRYAGGDHASWSHHRGHDMARRHYAAHEHRYPTHEQRYTARERYRVRHEDWREHYASRPDHRWRHTERERWNYSSHVYAPQPFRYDYVSRSRRSYYNYEEHEGHRDSSGPCCSCRQDCGGEYGAGYPGGYRPPMSINDPAALDPWNGYNDDNGFTDW